ncbi:MAG: hypothetical protein ACJZ12_03015 [Candidatus Neomarinimicrobiota bacterium]
MSFHPYVNYLPTVIPSENCEILLKDLSVYKKLINDHFEYNSSNMESKTKKIFNSNILSLFKNQKNNETIEQKIKEINEIRLFTNQYEAWPPSWEKNVEIVGEKLSIDEIDLIKHQIKKVSRRNVYF